MLGRVVNSLPLISIIHNSVRFTISSGNVTSSRWSTSTVVTCPLVHTTPCRSHTSAIGSVHRHSGRPSTPCSALLPELTTANVANASHSIAGTSVTSLQIVVTSASAVSGSAKNEIPTTSNNATKAVNHMFLLFCFIYYR